MSSQLFRIDFVKEKFEYLLSDVLSHNSTHLATLQNHSVYNQELSVTLDRVDIVRGILNTVDLLVLAFLDQPLLILKILFIVLLQNGHANEEVNCSEYILSHYNKLECLTLLFTSSQSKIFMQGRRQPEQNLLQDSTLMEGS